MTPGLERLLLATARNNADHASHSDALARRFVNEAETATDGDERVRLAQLGRTHAEAARRGYGAAALAFCRWVLA